MLCAASSATNALVVLHFRVGYRTCVDVFAIADIASISRPKNRTSLHSPCFARFAAGAFECRFALRESVCVCGLHGPEYPSAKLNKSLCTTKFVEHFGENIGPSTIYLLGPLSRARTLGQKPRPCLLFPLFPPRASNREQPV